MERLRSLSIPSFWLVPLLAILYSASIFAAVKPAPQQEAPQHAAVLEHLGNLSLAFTQNTGQWPDSIRFRANAGGATMWFTPTGAYYQFTRRIANASTATTTSDVSVANQQPDREPDSIETTLIKASFVGCNANPKLTGSDALAYRCNYFLGNDPAKWRTDVPNYTSVTYQDVYPSIDLRYYGDGRNMEYDFIVPPNVDYTQIQIQYSGATSLAVNNAGDLVVTTAWGSVTERAPLVYQHVGATRTYVRCAYQLTGELTFGFTLGSEYNTALAVVIDPVLSYSTFLGGTDQEHGRDIAVDKLGNAYVTGYTGSANFPTVSPYDGTRSGTLDVFVTKLNSTGAVVYSTFLGGSMAEAGYSIAVDSGGNAYSTGYTYSLNFPLANAYDTGLSFNGDVFVTKLNPTGDALVYSTYLGGSGADNSRSIAVSTSGNAYVTGNTASTDFPTVNAFNDSKHNREDAFVTKFAAAGSSLVYSTYLGGANTDDAYGIAVDSTGSAYVTGTTYSTDFPLASPYIGSFGGAYDAFVTKFNPAGNTLAYSTYLGGSGSDGATSIAVDSTGSAYVAGYTMSSNFPLQNPYSGTLLGGLDAFVTKFNPAGNGLVYSTFLGGSTNNESCSGIAIDPNGSAYVTGTTQSADFPRVLPLDATLGGMYDAFITKFNPAGSGLAYSTFVGGSLAEFGNCIAVDTGGNAYVSGDTYSTDFPTVNAFQPGYGGGSSYGGDAFIVRVSTPPMSCVGLTGNVDCDDNDRVDISDLTALIDYLYISLQPLCYDKEANVDGSDDGRIDISDLTALIDYLYISFTPLAPCL